MVLCGVGNVVVIFINFMMNDSYSIKINNLYPPILADVVVPS